MFTRVIQPGCRVIGVELEHLTAGPVRDQKWGCRGWVERRCGSVRGVVSQAVVIATGVTADGRREVLGFDVGDGEDGGVLDRVSARPEGLWPGWNPVDHRRRSHRFRAAIGSVLIGKRSRDAVHVRTLRGSKGGH